MNNHKLKKNGAETCRTKITEKIMAAETKEKEIIHRRTAKDHRMDRIKMQATKIERAVLIVTTEIIIVPIKKTEMISKDKTKNRDRITGTVPTTGIKIIGTIAETEKIATEISAKTIRILLAIAE